MCRMQRGATPILSLLVLLTWRDSNVRAAFWPQHRAHSDLGPANSPWRSASLHDEPLGGRGVMLTTASTEHAHLLRNCGIARPLSEPALNASNAGGQLVLVHYKPTSTTRRDILAAAAAPRRCGAKYIPHDTMLLWASPAAANRLLAVRGVTWVGRYSAELKLSPHLASAVCGVRPSGGDRQTATALLVSVLACTRRVAALAKFWSAVLGAWAWRAELRVHMSTHMSARMYVHMRTGISAHTSLHMSICMSKHRCVGHPCARGQSITIWAMTIWAITI